MAVDLHRILAVLNISGVLTLLHGFERHKIIAGLQGRKECIELFLFMALVGVFSVFPVSM